MNDGSFLPDDLNACHQLIAQLKQDRDQLSAELEEQSQVLQSRDAMLEEQSRTVVELASARESLSQKIEEQKLYIGRLLNRLYGRSSERFVDPDQLILEFGDDSQAAADALAEAVAEAEAVVEEYETKRRSKRRKKSHDRNRKFPDHFPRYEKIVDLPPEETVGLTFIGFDEVESLEFLRPDARVRVTKYAKYSDEKKRVVSPERPAGLVEGNRYDTSVAVEVIASRFFYHLPYYRQQDLFAGCGWTPSRSTLLNLVKGADFVLQPFVDYHRQLLGQIQYVGCDETSVTLIVPPALPELDPDHPRSARIEEVLSKAIEQGRPSVKGRMWAYRAIDLPFNLFDFTVSRHRDGPNEILDHFSGYLMGDCWHGFQSIELRTDARIKRLACWAHARRKFDECRLNHPRHCNPILAMIRQLYDLETRAVDWTAQERFDLRQRESVRVLNRIREYIDGPELQQILPKSDLAGAVGFLKNHWDALTLYTCDGHLPIDNNETEHLMRQVATGRKNWLHIGSVAAGMRAANIMSIVSTAARNDLDVWAYLKDVLDQILAGCTDWESLRADRWKERHPEAVRQYRADERRDAVDRRKARRAVRRLQTKRAK